MSGKLSKLCAKQRTPFLSGVSSSLPYVNLRVSVAHMSDRQYLKTPHRVSWKHCMTQHASCSFLLSLEYVGTVFRAVGPSIGNPKNPCIPYRWTMSCLWSWLPGVLSMILTFVQSLHTASAFFALRGWWSITQNQKGDTQNTITQFLLLGYSFLGTIQYLIKL